MSDFKPLYEMIIDDKTYWLLIRQAGIAYDSGWVPVSIGGHVLDGPGPTRLITNEERRRIADIADDWSASK